MIVILRGNKPCLIDKVMYTEHLLYKELKVISIVDYIPEWKKIKNSLANEQPNSNKKETEKLSFKTF